MMPGRLEILRADPLRPLNWRWRQAFKLHEQQTRLTKQRADRRIRGAVQFLRQRERCSTTRRRSGLIEKYEDLLAATDLAGAKTVTRSILESAILAGESSDRAGNRVGLSPRAVDAYEAMFFNVRDRLQSRGWVILAAIGLPRRQDDLQTRRLKLLRRLSYRGGRRVLDLLLSAWGLSESAQFRSNGFIKRRVELLEILENPGLDLAVLAEIAGFPELSQPFDFGREVAGLTSQLIPDRLLEPPVSAAPGPQDGVEPLPVTESADAA